MKVQVLKAFKDKKSHTDSAKMAEYRIGDKFKSDDIDRIKELAEGGYVEQPVEPKGLADKNMTELRKIAQQNEIEVEGTGKNGAVTKGDLVKALSDEK